jgi:hypothetical protein
MENHLNLLDRLKKDDKRQVLFDANFEIQASLEGDYYKPKAIHGVNYNALKFKQLKFPAATDVYELLTAPLMSNISIPLVSETTSYSVNLHNHSIFALNNIEGATFSVVSPTDAVSYKRIWMHDYGFSGGIGYSWNGTYATITSTTNPDIVMTGPTVADANNWIYKDVLMGGDYNINWTKGNEPGFSTYDVAQTVLFIADTSFSWSQPSSGYPSISTAGVYYVSNFDEIWNTSNSTYINGLDFTIPPGSSAGISLVGSTLSIDTTLWDNSRITVNVTDGSNNVSNAVNVTLPLS